jgi:hypothetical protein
MKVRWSFCTEYHKRAKFQLSAILVDADSEENCRMRRLHHVAAADLGTAYPEFLTRFLRSSYVNTHCGVSMVQVLAKTVRGPAAYTGSRLRMISKLVAHHTHTHAPSPRISHASDGNAWQWQSWYHQCAASVCPKKCSWATDETFRQPTHVYRNPCIGTVHVTATCSCNRLCCMHANGIATCGTVLRVDLRLSPGSM